MSGSERDLSVLRHILNYCDEIEKTVERFGADRELFLHDYITMQFPSAFSRSVNWRGI